MTDRELLELAAKAAGYVSHGYGELCGGSPSLYLQEADFTGIWSPLTDDGDALRLAVKLQIHMAKYDNYVSACQLGPAWGGEVVVWDHEEPDPYAATRRAITRAAAEMGKAMP
jgi:hypothetical protein